MQASQCEPQERPDGSENYCNELRPELGGRALECKQMNSKEILKKILFL